MKKKITFLIHDLNSWGGQDKSVLEIIKRLSHSFLIDIHSYTLSERIEGEALFCPIKPRVRRPVFLKSMIYYLVTWFRLGPLRRKSPSHRSLIHATGACSWISDVIQVQFIHTAWKQERKHLKLTVGWLRGAYQHTLLCFDVWMEKKVYRSNRAYIAISKSVAADLKKHFGLIHNVSVIHHGVDSTVFKPLSTKAETNLRNELKINSDDIVALFVGTYERKGLACSIKALALLPTHLKNKMILLAVGDGDQKKFEALAQENGVRDRVRFVSHKKEILSYYQSSDLFLLPTLYEPFGMVILEGMSCGLAPIVSKCAGASELIVEGESGLLIDDPTSSREVANQLVKLLSDPVLRKQMSEAARKVAERRSWDRVAEEYKDFLL